ncbi:isochorismate synthase [Azospirillum lipoferum]|uniref:isochorismate synthase n=1 Tax=Azospirillum lipoferum (strain 4B) TaxID=862719 RepID=G7ZCG0_AZOL4|nr:isochorismate synthase [Azospirillum lipoferum]CBS89339.1 Isochorismate synthase (Salicylate biosynthesis) [Azospirillum lipoferum 4B]
MLSDFLAIRLREALQGARRQAERHGETVLATASAPVEPSAFDLPSLFASRPKRLPAFLWLGTGDHGMVGLDVAWEAVAQGEERFSAIAAAWRRTAKNAVVSGEEGPVALGGFRFDPRRPTSELWRGFPDAVLSVPRFVLRLRHGRGQVIVSDAVDHATDIEARFTALLDAWSRLRELNRNPDSTESAMPELRERPGDRPAWTALVDRAVATIGRGELEKVVVARTVDMTFSAPVPTGSVLDRLRDANPKASVFAFERHGACFAGATPETLLTMENHAFQTMALAGSIGRGADPDEDGRAGERLLGSAKDRREHRLVVETLRRALEPFCTEIHTDAAPTLHKLPRVQHLMTRFGGRVRGGTSLIELVGRLHPTPAVGGVSLETALDFLRRHEDLDRGWYASPVGWIDTDGNGEFMVALRSALIDGRRATLFAGCGLVAGSEPDSEYRETLLKFVTMADALGLRELAVRAVPAPRTQTGTRPRPL